MLVFEERASQERKTYHFECPDTANPNLELALYAIDIIKFDAFPPASSCRLSPEEEKLLRHSHHIGVGDFITLDIGAETSKSDAANDSLVRFIGSVAPTVVVVEASAYFMVSKAIDSDDVIDLPSGQHLYQMLLSSSRFLALPQSAEDTILLQQCLTSGTFDFNHLWLLNVSSRWDDIKVQILPKNNYASPVLQHVAC